MYWHGKTSNSNNIAGSVEHCAAKQEELDPDENENGHEVEKEDKAKGNKPKVHTCIEIIWL